jgi:type IV secretion system protein TrbE
MHSGYPTGTMLTWETANPPELKGPHKYNQKQGAVRLLLDGHTLIVGPSGAGKSTALGLIAAQWFRYPRAQVFAFDRGYSIWMLTVAARGEFYDLAGSKTNLAFCPLKDIDAEGDVQWAVGWIEVLCELNGLKFAPKHRNAVAEAIVRLQLSPARTLTWRKR